MQLIYCKKLFKRYNVLYTYALAKIGLKKFILKAEKNLVQTFLKTLTGRIGWLKIEGEK